MQSINMACFNLIHGGGICTCHTRNHGTINEIFILAGKYKCHSWCCSKNHGINWVFDGGCFFSDFNYCNNSKDFQPTEIVMVPSRSYAMKDPMVIEYSVHNYQ